MADVQYIVEAVLKLQSAGSFNSGMQAAAAKADSLQASLSKVTGGLAGLGGASLDAISSLVTNFAKLSAVGLGAGLALGGKLAMGMGHVLSETENSANSLGAVIGAATGTGFREGKIASQDMFNTFREMAIESAAETKNFVDIAKDIAGPLLGAGKSLEFVQNMTRDVVNTASAAGIPFEQMGADVMRMAQGMAGAHEPTWRFLQSTKLINMAAHEFNALAPDKRVDMIAKALSNPAIREAAAAFGASFTGLKSTLVDEVKLMGAIVGGPAFELMKSKLSHLTGALQKGLHDPGFKQGLEDIGATFAFRAEQIGKQLARIFPDFASGAGTGMAKVQEYVDRGMSGLLAGTAWVADHWGQITDGAHKFAGAIEHAAEMAERLIKQLGGGDMTKGVERLAEIVVGGKMAQAAGPTLGNIAQIGGGTLQATKALGMIGGGSAAPGAAEAAGLAATATGAAVAIGVLGAAFVAFEAISLDSLHVFQPWIDQIKAAFVRLGPLRAELAHMVEQAGRLWHALEPLVSALGTVGVLLSPLGLGFAILAKTLDPMLEVLTKMAYYANLGTEALIHMINAIKEKLGMAGDADRSKSGNALPSQHEALLHAISGPIVVLPSGKTDTTKPPPKQGVEVTIKWELGDGNEDKLYAFTHEQIRKSLAASRSHVSRGRMPG